MNTHSKLKNRIQGAKNQASGASAESRLMDWCAKAGIELVKKDPPIAVVRRFSNGTFLARYKEKSKPDFYGQKNGRYIEIECKSVQSESFPYSKLPAHQRDSLIAATKSGGAGLLAILFGDHFAVFQLPHEKFVPGKSIRAESPGQVLKMDSLLM